MPVYTSINSLNIQKELEWLEQVIHVRLKTSFSQVNTTPFVSQLQFDFVPRDSDITLISPTQKSYKVSLLYEEDLKTVRKNEKGYQLVAVHGHLFHILEDKGDRVKIRCRVQGVSEAGKVFIPEGTTVETGEGWLARSGTDIPESYHVGISKKELDQALPTIPEKFKKVMAEDVRKHDEIRLLNYITEEKNITCIPAPDLKEEDSAYAGIIYTNELDFYDRLLLILATALHVNPVLLEKKLMKNGERISPLAGGVRGVNSGVFLPTGQTFIFLAAGNDLETRLKIIDWLCCESLLIASDVLRIQPAQAGEPYLSGALVVNEYYLQLLLTNRSNKLPPSVSPISQSNDTLKERA